MLSSLNFLLEWSLFSFLLKLWHSMVWLSELYCLLELDSPELTRVQTDTFKYAICRNLLHLWEVVMLSKLNHGFELKFVTMLFFISAGVSLPYLFRISAMPLVVLDKNLCLLNKDVYVSFYWIIQISCVLKSISMFYSSL